MIGHAEGGTLAGRTRKRRGFLQGLVLGPGDSKGKLKGLGFFRADLQMPLKKACISVYLRMIRLKQIHHNLLILGYRNLILQRDIDGTVFIVANLEFVYGVGTLRAFQDRLCGLFFFRIRVA